MNHRASFAAWEIVSDLRRHLRFRFVRADALASIVFLIGTVLDVEHKDQAERIAAARWPHVENGIAVAIWAFVIFHMACDAGLLRLAWTIKYVVPHDDALFVAVHEIAMVALFAAFLFDLLRHLWRQLQRT